MIGAHRFQKDWKDHDLDFLAVDRGAAPDVSAWDRASHTQAQLESWVRGGLVSAFGEDDEGRIQPIETKWTTTPYFQLSVLKGQFKVFPDAWDTLLVDGPELETRLSKIRRLRPRKSDVFDWRLVANQAWKFALEQPLPRTESWLVGTLLQWHADLKDHDPDPQELTQLAREIIRHLGNRTLSTEVFAEERSAD